MRFPKNNKIKYRTNLYENSIALPSDIEFIIQKIDSENIELVAPGYDHLFEKGKIFVELNQFSARDRILIEREFEKSKSCCCDNCSCGKQK